MMMMTRMNQRLPSRIPEPAQKKLPARKRLPTIITITKRAVRLTGCVVFALLTCRMFLTSQTRSKPGWSPRLILTITDRETGRPVAARFSLVVEQVFVVTYARGTGPVEVPLRPGAKRVEVRVAKGFDYVPETVTTLAGEDPVRVKVALRRWNQLREEGWRAADDHLHYDRVRPEYDQDWFDAMDADGLTHAQFLTLKGGMVPGVWARQYAYGKAGEGTDGERLIVPGEEYRDRLQGHLLLFGLSELIQPIMAGTKDSPHNYPVFVDVLQRARHLGGMVGAAHGATLGASPTGLADAVLGALDFMEIGNLFIWAPENWYRLMSCGFVLPPTAGSDLPNVPYRDGWQPFLGSIRTYVKVGDRRGSGEWNRAVRRGEVFVTSGPIIRLSVNGTSPGGTVNLPAEGGEVAVEAELSSPLEMKSLEVVKNGKMVAAHGPGRDRLVVRQKLPIATSCWIAAKGEGAHIAAMDRDAVAHTAAVQVIVGGQPIWSPEVATSLIAELEKQKEFYATKGSYALPAHRQEALRVFDQAIARLRNPPK
jgi:hypothetical protein